MRQDIKNIALDSGLDESHVNGRLDDLELLQRTNLNPNGGGTTEHEGYGMSLRHPNQEGCVTDQIYLAKDKNELKAICDQIAQDDTVAYGIPSNGVLEYLTSVFNFKPIEQLLQTTASRVMTTDWQQGAFGTTDVYVPTVQYMGNTAVYSDQSPAGASSVNYNWVQRQAVSLQKTLEYGDLATARFGMGKIDYVAGLRKAATSLIALDINRINFKGYAGMRIFGLLNDPSLRTVLVSPASAANPSSSQWFYKTYAEICTDIQSLYSDITSVAGGNADYKMPATLGIPPCVYTFLVNQNALGTQIVQGYLNIAFPGLKVVQVQDYQGTGTPIGASVPNYCQLVLDDLNGDNVAVNVFSSLYYSHGVVRLLSSYAEKISYTVSGSLIKDPIGVSTMSGI